MGGTKIAAVAAVISVAMIHGASPAHADNASYLAVVGPQFTTPTGDDGLLRIGKAACSLLSPNAALMFGRHPNLVAQIVWEQNPQLERPEAAIIVNAAIDNLCPGVNPWGYAAV